VKIEMEILMRKLTNEMALSIISAPVMGIGGDVGMGAQAPAASAMDSSVAIGSPTSQYDPQNISVYSQSITPVSYNTGDEVAAFDIVFSVGINCGDEGTKTYMVVKRIGIDKRKIADEAGSTTPVSIVEGKSTTATAEETKRRFRRLAGLD
jgi:hypothetical protein